jgi:hypothetical protein
LAQASVSRQEAGLLLKLLVHPEPEVRGAALSVMAATADEARPPPVTAQVELGRKCSFGLSESKNFHENTFEQKRDVYYIFRIIKYARIA